MQKSLNKYFLFQDKPGFEVVCNPPGVNILLARLNSLVQFWKPFKAYVSNQIRSNYSYDEHRGAPHLMNPQKDCSWRSLRQYFWHSKSHFFKCIFSTVRQVSFPDCFTIHWVEQFTACNLIINFQRSLAFKTFEKKFRFTAR